MVSDIRIDTKLPRHWKYKKLKRLIACIPMEYLITFWGSIAEQVPTGLLTGWTVEDIEDAAGWDGEPGVFCSALVRVKFLDVTEDGFYPHDWEDHQPWVIEAPERAEIARKAGLASAEARKQKYGSAQPSRTSAEHKSNIPEHPVPMFGRTPSPSPSPSPLPSPLDIEGEIRARDEKMTLHDFSRGYQETFGVIMPGGINQEAREICNHYPREKIIEAFAITAENGGNSLKYLKEVLKGKPRPRINTRGQLKTFEAMKQENTIQAMHELHEDIDNGRTGLEAIFGTGSNTGNGIRSGSVEGKTVGLLPRSG